jgi:3-hydroxybutyryl-CoA dehydratase
MLDQGETISSTLGMKEHKVVRYWEEIQIGASYVSEEMNIAEDEVFQFASLSGDFMPLYLDEEFAKRTIYGQRIVHGMLVQAKIIGMSHELGGWAETSLGFLEVNWKFDNPVFIQDKYVFEIIVEDKRETNRHDVGILHQLVIVRNSVGEVVQQGQIVHLIRRRVITADFGIGG